MGSALGVSLILRAVGSRVAAFDPQRPAGFALSLIVTTAVTTAVWLGVTLATRPESDEVLQRFYAKVRPAGPGWKRIAQVTGIHPRPGEIRRGLTFWVLGTVFVYSIMFSLGGVILHQPSKAIGFGVTLILSGALLLRGLVTEPAT